MEEPLQEGPCSPEGLWGPCPPTFRAEGGPRPLAQGCLGGNPCLLTLPQAGQDGQDLQGRIAKLPGCRAGTHPEGETEGWQAVHP